MVQQTEGSGSYCDVVVAGSVCWLSHADLQLVPSAVGSRGVRVRSGLEVLWARDEELPAEVMRVERPPRLAGRMFVEDSGWLLVGEPVIADGRNWHGYADAAAPSVAAIMEQAVVDKEPGSLTDSWGKARKLPLSWQERSGVYCKPDKRK